MSDENESLKSEGDKPEEAVKPVEAATEAPRPSAPAKASVPRTKKEKILIGALIVAIIGTIVAAVHTARVVDQAGHPISKVKTSSEAELLQDEAQFQPKNTVAIPADSAVMHEKKAEPKKVK